ILMMKICHWLVSYCLILLCTLSCKKDTNNQAKNEVKQWYESHLGIIIQNIEGIALSKDIQTMEARYKTARNAFKACEPIIAFSDLNNYKYLNRPNLEVIEEEDATQIKYPEVTGFQVLEESIFIEKDTALAHKHASIMLNRLKFLSNNLYLEPFENYHFLWMLRDGFLRVACIGISPFDSPAQNRQLKESAIVLRSLDTLLTYYSNEFSDEKLSRSWKDDLNKAINILEAGNPDTFNAYDYHKHINEKLLKNWAETVKDWKVKFPFEMALKHKATSLYSDSTFNMTHFSKQSTRVNESEYVVLGEKLFNETKLSKTKTMSCGSCHIKANGFTDNKPIAFLGSRNTPTLPYVGLQNSFFYDAREGSLEGQSVDVINNSNEFHSNTKDYYKGIEADLYYQKKFKKLYQKPVNDQDIRNAIASYERSLNAFNSKFDRNIRGEENTFTSSEIRGFNIYMGKAQCNTCHFTPLFNGTVPPDFTESELEHIGVPATLQEKGIDSDLGRYYVYKTEGKKHFFKTPTLRNIDKTAPYMHNGVYKTLEEVIDFYNKGGGNGLGFKDPKQTLSSEPLNLSDAEKVDLVNFLKTLSDGSNSR
ncbi:MAG: cytochrome-c peroxidase, partial [Leadbetterella sp.]